MLWSRWDNLSVGRRRPNVVRDDRRGEARQTFAPHVRGLRPYDGQVSTTEISPSGSHAEFDIIGTHADAERRIDDLLQIIEIIRPVVAADGGELHVVSVDVDDGIVTLRLAGACGSCAVSSTTLNQGVDRILRDRLDWVTKIIGQVEESDVDGYGGWTPKLS
jgi:Fe-S cluster biogenesis protein NfuA